MERTDRADSGGKPMTDNKQKQPEPVHYCNTCKYSQMPITQAPCHECVPRKFGGPDRWEKRDDMPWV